MLALTTMPQGICRLCKADAELQLSHIVPAFVFRWLRESSGNGHIRRSNAPNLRVQDGPQEHWLCGACEARFGRYETAFASKLFYPYIAASGQRFRYADWLLRFCASVSWRNLLFQLDRGVNDFSPAAQQMFQQAEVAWRDFLMERTPHPGAFRQHLLPLDRIASTARDLPPNINRYLMRAVDIDLCHGGETIFVYSKLGRFVIIGFIDEPNPHQWVGAKINANEGTVEPRHYVFPAPFGNFLMEKAGRLREAMGSVSDRQRQKIEQSFRSNIDRTANSDFFNAMQADVEMFGQSAFTPHNEPSSER